jgi:hypothetical protein
MLAGVSGGAAVILIATIFCLLRFRKRLAVAAKEKAAALARARDSLHRHSLSRPSHSDGSSKVDTLHDEGPRRLSMRRLSMTMSRKSAAADDDGNLGGNGLGRKPTERGIMAWEDIVMQGAFSTIGETGKLYFAKVPSDDSLDGQPLLVRHMMSDMLALQPHHVMVARQKMVMEVEHNNLLKMIAPAIDDGPNHLHAGVLMPRMRHSLSTVLMRIEKSVEFANRAKPFLATVIGEVASAVLHLHKHHKLRIWATHPRNILLDEQLSVKLTDYGRSREVMKMLVQHPEAEEDATESGLTDPDPRHFYYAPELLSLGKVNGTIDSWTIGCLIVRVASMLPLYHDLDSDGVAKTVKQKLDLIAEGHATPIADAEGRRMHLPIMGAPHGAPGVEHVAWLNKEFSTVAVACLEADVEKRANISWVSHHIDHINHRLHKIALKKAQSERAAAAAQKMEERKAELGFAHAMRLEEADVDDHHHHHHSGAPAWHKGVLENEGPGSLHEIIERHKTKRREGQTVRAAALPSAMRMPAPAVGVVEKISKSVPTAARLPAPSLEVTAHQREVARRPAHQPVKQHEMAEESRRSHLEDARGRVDRRGSVVKERPARMGRGATHAQESGAEIRGSTYQRGVLPQLRDSSGQLVHHVDHRVAGAAPLVDKEEFHSRRQRAEASPAALSTVRRLSHVALSSPGSSSRLSCGEPSPCLTSPLSHSSDASPADRMTRRVSLAQDRITRGTEEYAHEQEVEARSRVAELMFEDRLSAGMASAGTQRRVSIATHQIQRRPSFGRPEPRCSRRCSHSTPPGCAAPTMHPGNDASRWSSSSPPISQSQRSQTRGRAVAKELSWKEQQMTATTSGGHKAHVRI